jgi:uncharacterized MAPEG superfamily protein
MLTNPTQCANGGVVVQELKRQHKQTLARFMEVEKEHAREREWKAERAAAAEKARAAEEQRKALEALHSMAVSVIQAHWKGYKARQLAKSSVKGKGKGGKSKKRGPV